MTTELVEQVLSGSTRAAARLCRLIDDRGEGHREALRALYASSPRGYVVGVTGSPGAGKSTLVDRLCAAFRAEGARVGVIAVDPTSPYSGGAVLGDRIRMQRHFEDPEVFIRSVATRGALGGLSRTAGDLVRVLEAWGAGVVLLETVGVGQDGLDVTLAADTTIVVLSPGQGDDVQAIKAGILECADVFAVNKADRPGADATVRDVESMLALGAISRAALAKPVTHATSRLAALSGASDGDWTPPVVKTIASQGEGVPELVRKLAEHRAWISSERGRARRAARARERLHGWLRDAIAEAVTTEFSDELSALAKRIGEGATDPYSAVEELLAEFRGPRAEQRRARAPSDR